LEASILLWNFQFFLEASNFFWKLPFYYGKIPKKNGIFHNKMEASRKNWKFHNKMEASTLPKYYATNILKKKNSSNLI